jgi:hypothetical protein
LPATPGAAGGVPAAWYPDQFKGLMELKGFPDAGTFIESYANLEKLHGDPSRLVRLPKGEEGRAEYRQKMGIPDAPEGYKLPDALKEDPVAKALVPIAHKYDLTDSQLAGFLADAKETLSAQAAQADTVTQQAAKVDHDKRMTNLKNELGAEYDTFMENARRAIRVVVPEAYKDPATGVQLSRDDIMGALEAAVGVDLVAKIFNTAGAFNTEDKLVTGGAPQGIISAEAARERLGSLIADRSWGARLLSNPTGPEAQEKNRLDLIIASSMSEQRAA